MDADPRMFAAAKAGWREALRVHGRDTLLRGKTLADHCRDDIARLEADFLARLPAIAAKLYPAQA
jgi:hypothetical protein